MLQKRAALRLTTAVIAMLYSTGCAGEGSLVLTTWGEAFIEEGIPAGTFEDDWSVTFSKFLVVVTEARVADDDGAVALETAGAVVNDLVQSGPFTMVTAPAVPARRYNAVEVVVAPDADAVAGSASADDVARMVDGGLSIHVEGSASRGDDIATFAWSFATATRYSACETVGDGEGQVVRADEENTAQLTVHGDHLFYDDLAAENAVLRFDGIFGADGAAGDAADGVIALDELDAVDLTTLPSDQYGSAGTAETLGDFVTSLSRTIIHFNGEGECSISSP
jgi:hypothetical protein